MTPLRRKYIMKQQIYEKIFPRKSGMDYSPSISFENTLVNINEARALFKTNQPEKHKGKIIHDVRNDHTTMTAPLLFSSEKLIDK